MSTVPLVPAFSKGQDSHFHCDVSTATALLATADNAPRIPSGNRGRKILMLASVLGDSSLRGYPPQQHRSSQQHGARRMVGPMHLRMAVGTTAPHHEDRTAATTARQGRSGPRRRGVPLLRVALLA